MKRAVAVFLFASSFVFAGCDNESSNPGPSIEGALTVRSFSALPVCWFGKRGTVYFVSDTETLFYCDGRNYVALDFGGMDGADGVGWVVNVTEASADACPSGGALISAGPDGDGDGVADELTSSQPVCDGADGQDGTSCTVTDDGAGTVTIACEDGTLATVSDGQDGRDGQNGQDGQDGQNGTSCTVTRDDAAGTTTISCEDGTFAVVEDGQDGQDGEGSGSCTIAETAAGAEITCGSDTVEITDGQGGSSCSASTDPTNGAVTISCDDGSSATIPGGSGDGEDSVALLCNLIALNRLDVPNDLECAPFCPCYTAEEVAASDATGCTDGFFFSFGISEVASVPRSGSGNVGSIGEFTLRSEGLERECFGPGQAFVDLSDRGQNNKLDYGPLFSECANILESTVGPCRDVTFCTDGFCPPSTTPCRENVCDVTGPRPVGLAECVLRTSDNGTACTTTEGDPGQCFVGNCQPTIGGGGGPGF